MTSTNKIYCSIISLKDCHGCHIIQNHTHTNRPISVNSTQHWIYCLCVRSIFFFASDKWWYTLTPFNIIGLKPREISYVQKIILTSYPYLWTSKEKQIVFALNCLRCFDFIAFNVWQQMLFYGMQLHTSTPPLSSQSFSCCFAKTGSLALLRLHFIFNLRNLEIFPSIQPYP